MCEVCRSTPCNPMCPNAPQVLVMGHCRACNADSDMIIHISEIQMMIFSVLVNVPNFFTALPRKNGQ